MTGVPVHRALAEQGGGDAGALGSDHSGLVDDYRALSTGYRPASPGRCDGLADLPRTLDMYQGSFVQILISVSGCWHGVTYLKLSERTASSRRSARARSPMRAVLQPARLQLAIYVHNVLYAEKSVKGPRGLALADGDATATGRRSSFHESLAPAWGLHEYSQATSDPTAKRAAELLLEHRLFRSQVINRAWPAPATRPHLEAACTGSALRWSCSCDSP
jgi:hypothetical protein